VKGRIVIFVGIALTAGIIALHLRQSNSGTSPQPSTTVTEKTIPKILPQQLNARNQNSVSDEITTATVQSATNAVANTSAFTDRMALIQWMRNLAATNFTAALEYISKMPDGDERDDAVQAACLGLGQKDPRRAIEAAQQLQAPGGVAENIVQQWAASDFKSALKFVADQPAGDDRDKMIHRVVYVLASTDPSDAAGLVLEQIPAGSAQDEAVMTVLNEWAYKDFKSAIQWVETFPDGPLRERAVKELEGIHQYQSDLAKQ